MVRACWQVSGRSTDGEERDERRNKPNNGKRIDQEMFREIRSWRNPRGDLLANVAPYRSSFRRDTQSGRHRQAVRLPAMWLALRQA